MTEKEDFEAMHEQEAHDGHDVVRFAFQSFAEAVGAYEENYIDGGVLGNVTPRQYAEICGDILYEFVSKSWNYADSKKAGESLLFSGSPSERMQKLRDGDIDPTPEDVTELLGEFMGAISYSDYWKGSYTLKAFGHWLAGTGEFEGNLPAEVIW